MKGQSEFTGVPSLASLPDRYIKMATIDAEEVETEALAFALTQLIVFEDRLLAINDLLEQCDYDAMTGESSRRSSTQLRLRRQQKTLYACLLPAAATPTKKAASKGCL